MNEQIFMGSSVALLCITGLWKAQWFLENTRKGQRFVKIFGEERAIWAWRVLLLLGVIFGTLLATGIINPIHW